MIEFFVPGVAKPGGSKTAFTNKKTGRAMIVDACKGNKPWRLDVMACAKLAMLDKSPLTGQLYVTAYFYLPRPKGHIGKNGQPKKNAPARPVTRPDVLKLMRTVEDALTGIVYADDAQIVTEDIRKFYAQVGPDKDMNYPPGVRIWVDGDTDGE